MTRCDAWPPEGYSDASLEFYPPERLVTSEKGTRKAIEREQLELSTQLLIAECQRRGLSVEVLDYSDNLLQISDGRHTEIIYQATLTRLDNMSAYAVLKNKAVCKELLHRRGIPVIPGTSGKATRLLDSPPTALVSHDLVVKPNSQTKGTGIEFVPCRNEDAYRKAVLAAANYDQILLVEKRIPHPETRYLVILGRVVSALRRLPAQVEGDGVSSIRTLVERKNRQRRSWRSR